MTVAEDTGWVVTVLVVVAVLAVLALAAWRLDVRSRLQRGETAPHERARTQREIGRQIDDGRTGGQTWL